jgi:hypothetical protein
VSTLVRTSMHDAFAHAIQMAFVWIYLRAI